MRALFITNVSVISLIFFSLLALAQDRQLTSTPSSVVEQKKELDLTLDPDFNVHSTPVKQKKLTPEKDSELLPDIFKDKQNKGNVSMTGELITEDESGNFNSTDGAKISIKVKTK